MSSGIMNEPDPVSSASSKVGYSASEQPTPRHNRLKRETRLAILALGWRYVRLEVHRQTMLRRQGSGLRNRNEAIIADSRDHQGSAGHEADGLPAGRLRRIGWHPHKMSAPVADISARRMNCVKRNLLTKPPAFPGVNSCSRNHSKSPRQTVAGYGHLPQAAPAHARTPRSRKTNDRSPLSRRHLHDPQAI